MSSLPLLLAEIMPAAAEAATAPAQSAPAGHAISTETYIALLFILVLSTFIGLELIKGVSRLLHTPLMSLTNAISAIAVVGSIVLAGRHETTLSTVLGVVAVFASMTNIVSGFLITDRMLKMFKKKEAK